MTSTISDCLSGYKFSLLQPLPLHIFFFFLSFFLLSSPLSKITLHAWCQGVLSLRISLGCTTEQCKIQFLIQHLYFHIFCTINLSTLSGYAFFIYSTRSIVLVYFFLFLFCRIAFPEIESIIILENKAGLFWVFWRDNTIIAELHWSENVQEGPKVPWDSEHHCIFLAGCITRLCL